MTEDGPPPVLTSLWGEFHMPEAHPLFAGSRRYVYKPFDTGPESSPRFIALQIDRAVEAIHGIERDPLEKYEDLDEEFIAGAGEGCCSVKESVGRASDTRSRVFALAGIISAAFYSVIIAFQIGYGGKHGGKHPGNLILPGAVIMIFLVIMSVVLAGKAGLCEPSFVEAVPSIYMRRLADVIPLSTRDALDRFLRRLRGRVLHAAVGLQTFRGSDGTRCPEEGPVNASLDQAPGSHL